jgi:hypothetical protein
MVKGYKQTMSEDAIKQRVEAGKMRRVHGVYAIRDRGEDAMTSEQLSLRAELDEQLSTREGAVEALKDAAISTLILAKVAQNYCVEQHQGGKKLDSIPLLQKLPAFWNSASRTLQAYLSTLEKGKEGIITAQQVIEAITNEQSKSE